LLQFYGFFSNIGAKTNIQYNMKGGIIAEHRKSPPLSFPRSLQTKHENE
jgi:hypothetical protein